jgi:hypothetical protein
VARLRRYTASTLIAGNVGVTAAASMLGHTVAECFETYAQWWPSENDVLRTTMSRAWVMT